MIFYHHGAAIQPSVTRVGRTYVARASILEGDGHATSLGDLGAFASRDGAYRVFVGWRGTVDRVDRRHHVGAIRVHGFEREIFLGWKVVVDAGRFHADQSGLVAVTEPVVAARRQQGLVVIQQRFAYGVLVHFCACP